MTPAGAAATDTLTDHELGIIYDALMAEGNRELAVKVRDIRTNRHHTEPSVEARVRQAYTALAPRAGAWLRHTDVRHQLTDLPSEALDQAFRVLSHAQDVDMMPESNQKTLTAEDRRNAVRVGGQDTHLIAIRI
jgi:hypothetical protein